MARAMPRGQAHRGGQFGSSKYWRTRPDMQGMQPGVVAALRRVPPHPGRFRVHRAGGYTHRDSFSFLAGSTYPPPYSLAKYFDAQPNSRVSLWNTLSASVLAPAHLIHDAAAGAEQTDLYGVRVQVQNLSNLPDGKSFYLFQDQHHAIALIQALQQILHLLLGLQFVRDVLGAAIKGFAGAELLDLL